MVFINFMSTSQYISNDKVKCHLLVTYLICKGLVIVEVYSHIALEISWHDRII